MTGGTLCFRVVRPFVFPYVRTNIFEAGAVRNFGFTGRNKANLLGGGGRNLGGTNEALTYFNTYDISRVYGFIS